MFISKLCRCMSVAPRARVRASAKIFAASASSSALKAARSPVPGADPLPNDMMSGDAYILVQNEV